MERRIFKEGNAQRVRGRASWEISGVLEVEVRQAGFRYRRVSSVKDVGMCAKMLLRGTMDQLESRATLIHRDESLTTVQQGRYCEDVIVIEMI